MMCYKDMTFCPYDECANFNSCVRALTDLVQAKARAWWGSTDAPICIYGEQPDCFEGDTK